MTEIAVNLGDLSYENRRHQLAATAAERIVAECTFIADSIRPDVTNFTAGTLAYAYDLAASALKHDRTKSSDLETTDFEKAPSETDFNYNVSPLLETTKGTPLDRGAQVILYRLIRKSDRVNEDVVPWSKGAVNDTRRIQTFPIAFVVGGIPLKIEVQRWSSDQSGEVLYSVDSFNSKVIKP